MGIAKTSTNTAAAQLQSEVCVAVVKKSMDAYKEVAALLIEDMESMAVSPMKQGHLDLSV